MKSLFFLLTLTLFSQVSLAHEKMPFCYSGKAPTQAAERLPAGQLIDGSVICSSKSGVENVIPTSSDACCYHRGADGTCYHPNPACAGCECYHRGADGTCYHCSCPQGC